MIYGIGCDTVDIKRFAVKLETTPALKMRLFTSGERDLSLVSLAARFAAKEALIKALGGSTLQNLQTGAVKSLGWQDLEVLETQGTKPIFSKTPALTAVLEMLGLSDPHLSISHDGDVAQAFVIVEEKRL